MARTKVNPTQIKGLATDLKLDFGNGTEIAALIAGANLATPKKYIKIGSTLIQWGSVTFSLSGSGATNSFSFNWETAFGSISHAFVEPVTGWIMSVDGGIESVTTTGISGYYRSNEGTFPRNITVHILGIGT